MPPKMNTWETEFGQYLDADDTAAVLWWHRNPSRKPESINVLLESGQGFFPDFIVGIKERPKLDHGLLADTKYAYETARELPKILAEHQDYGRVLILSRADPKSHWALARVDQVTGKASLGAPFQFISAKRY
jgi:hypothetical protein